MLQGNEGKAKGMGMLKDTVGGGDQRTYSVRSLHGQVVHALGRRIVSGQVAEGAILPIETDLGIEFKVSRTALREGIKVLAAKGLLASRTRTGTRVRPRSDWNMLDPDILAWRLEAGEIEGFVQDLYEFRQAVEPMAAALAAERATDQEIADMDVALNDMAAAGGDVQASIEPDLRFHNLILRSSRNELLASLGSMIETALSFSFQLAVQETKVEAVDVHRAVFAAISARDSAGAQAAMLKLLDFSCEWNNTVLQQLGLTKDS